MASDGPLLRGLLPLLYPRRCPLQLGVSSTTSTNVVPLASSPATTSSSTAAGLSGGAIAGIVIGVIVGVALIVALIVYFTCFSNRGATKQKVVPTDTDGAVAPAAQAGGQAGGQY